MTKTKMFKRKSPIGLTVATLVAIGCVAGPATSALADEEPEKVASDEERYTNVLLPFDVSLAMSDALEVSSSLTENVVALRVENAGLEGEFALDGSLSTAEYLATFAKNYGTQPEVIGAVVLRPDSKQERRSGPEQPIDTGKADFVAPPVSLSQELLERANGTKSAATGSRSAAAAIAADWRPNSVSVQLLNTSTSNRVIYGGASWNSGSKPQLTPTKFGLEFEMANQYENSMVGTRSLCYLNGVRAFDYKDKFWAKNYSWSWTAFSAMGTMGAVASYADYNDISDDCNQQGITIGIRYPHKLGADSFGQYDINFEVYAPRGTDVSSRIGARVQPVSDGACVVSGVSLTDCMGVASGTWPAGLPSYRMVLNETNGNYTPSLCWTSNDKGTTKALIETCSF